MNPLPVILLCLVALSSIPVAWWPEPDRIRERRTGTILGAKVDPSSIRGLRVAGWFGPSQMVRVAELQRAGGAWTVTSAQGLPVNGNTRASLLANVFATLTTGRLATRDPSRHGAMKVLDPLAPWDPALNPEFSLGIRLTISGTDRVINDFIVGRTAEGSGGSLYVRPADRDEVYLASFDPRDISFRLADLVNASPMAGIETLGELTIRVPGYPDRRFRQNDLGDWESPQCPPGMSVNYDAISGITGQLETLPLNGARRHLPGITMEDVVGTLTVDTPQGVRLTLAIGPAAGSPSGWYQGQAATVPSRLLQVTVESVTPSADPAAVARLNRVFGTWWIELDAAEAPKLLPPPWVTYTKVP